MAIDWTHTDLETAMAPLLSNLVARGDRMVVFVGAGVSCESGVPLGDKIRDAIVGATSKLLRVGHTRPDGTQLPLEDYLSNLAKRMPSRNQEFIARLLADSGIPQPGDFNFLPSDLHMAVARLAAYGLARLIISLNFDELLERCLTAEMGPPNDPAPTIPNPLSSWICLPTPARIAEAGGILDAYGEPKFGCVLIKPHGTISKPDQLVAAHDHVSYSPAMKQMLRKAFADNQVHVLFLGCSLSDSDLYQVFEDAPDFKARASITVFDIVTPDKWISKGKEALSRGQHLFEMDGFSEATIGFIECKSAEAACGESATDQLHSGLRLVGRDQNTPGQVLLNAMHRASQANGHLREKNAPSVTDIVIHSRLRDAIVGGRPAIEAFLATEILIGAAHENGLCDQKRLINSRGHLTIASESGMGVSIDGLCKSFVGHGIFIPERDESPRFALRAIWDLPHKWLDALGPMRSVDSGWLHELDDLLLDLCVHKAARSSWKTATAPTLVSLEQKTEMVLATTDKLSIVSEYGTWTRKDRFKQEFLRLVERARKHGGDIQIILASPPPLGTQGYLEWLASCVWYLKNPPVDLYVLDADKHNHHMNVGQQAALSFRREGTSVNLSHENVDVRKEARRRLQQEFDELRDQAQPFSVWQLDHGLHLRVGNAGVQFFCPAAESNVALVYGSSLDRHVPDSGMEDARKKWVDENERRRRDGRPELRDLPLFRPGRSTLQNEGLMIECGVTGYFDNFILGAPTQRWSPDTTVGAGLSIVPVCCDGHILIGKRSSVVATGVGKYHVVGGHAHPAPNFRQEPQKLREAISEEMREEMFLSEKDIAKDGLQFLGIGFDYSISKPEFLFVARLKDPAQHYRTRFEEKLKEVGTANSLEAEFTAVTTLWALDQGTTATAENPSKKYKITFQAIHRHTERLLVAAQSALFAFWISQRYLDRSDEEGDLISDLDGALR